MEGAGPTWEKEHPQAARLLEGLKASFDVALHAYLTSCSEKEFGEIFAHFDQHQRRRLWNLFKQVVVAIHKNCQRQLWNIIRDQKVAEFLYHGELQRVGGCHDETMSDGQEQLQAAQEALLSDLATKVKLVKERALKLEAENSLATRLVDIRREEVLKQIEEIRQQCEARYNHRLDELEGCRQAFLDVAEYVRQADF